MIKGLSHCRYEAIESWPSQPCFCPVIVTAGSQSLSRYAILGKSRLILSSLLHPIVAMLHLISVLAFIPFVLCAPNWVTVHTSNGPITGHTTDGNVVEYLGIPYAEPPVRSLRFMPPQKLKSSRPYEAAHWVSRSFMEYISTNLHRDSMSPSLM